MMKKICIDCGEEFKCNGDEPMMRCSEKTKCCCGKCLLKPEHYSKAGGTRIAQACGIKIPSDWSIS